MSSLRFSNLIFAGLVLLVASGCSKSSAPKDTEIITEGAKRTEVKASGQVFKGDGYSLSMPESWKVLDLRSGDFQKGLDELAKDPRMAGAAAAVGQAAQNKQMKLFALMSEPGKEGFAPNLNILEIPVPIEMAESQVFDENAKQIEAMTKTRPEREVRKVGSTNILVMRWGHEMMGNPLNATSALVWKNKTQYVFTFTTIGTQDEKSKKEIDGVINSIRFE